MLDFKRRGSWHLDIEGFIFILGLNYGTIYKLLSGANLINNSENDKLFYKYIHKLIQVNITIPEWTTSNIRDLVNYLSTKLDDKYRKIIRENEYLIARLMKSIQQIH